MDIVWALLRGGASVRLTTHNGMTALHLAVVKGHLECADMLLTFAPDLISMANKSGSTPLHLAALHGRLDCMRLLIDNWRAEVDSVDIDKCTPLRVAAGHCRLDCMRLLLDRGAAVDGCSESERTPLVATGRTSRLVLALECILLLLQRGAAIDAGFGARVALVAVMKSNCEVLLRVLWRCGGKVLKSADSAAASAAAAGKDKPGAALLAAWHAGALRTWTHSCACAPTSARASSRPRPNKGSDQRASSSIERASLLKY
jgi:ankyrin repeat protein